MPHPTARSLILDLLSTLRRGTMPVKALVEAGALMGIEENNVRVSLARLLASGRIERDARGRYRLGPAVAAVRDQVARWRDVGSRTRVWRGDYVAVHTTRVGRGPERRRRERALEFLGFRSLEPGLSLRPNNLRGGVTVLREELARLSTRPTPEARTPEAPLVSAPERIPAADWPGRVFVLSELDDESERAARSLWDETALSQQARAQTARLQESAQRLPLQPVEAAMVESFLVGGEALRLLVAHPLLPAEILDPAPLRDLLSEMKRYDRLGRQCWSAFLARHEVPHTTLPTNVRAA